SWPAAYSPLSTSSSMKNGAANRLAPEVALPYPQVRARSTARSVLAPGAIEGGSPPLDDALYNASTAARLSLAIVDRKFLREIAEFPVRRGEVAQGRTAGGDRFFEHLVDCR